jgi:hypothetical protein
MFQFPRLPPHFAVLTHYGEGVAPFGDLRIGLSAAPRSLSQRNHVLLRPWLPRHPPYALIRLIFLLSSPPLHTFVSFGWLSSISFAAHYGYSTLFREIEFPFC